MKKEPEDLKMLAELIHVCRDSNKGYWQAAYEVENPRIRQIFREKALERDHFLYDLREIAMKSGMEPSTEGTFAGACHRAWLNVIHFMNPQKDDIVVKECRRGEEHALGVYQDIFERNLLPESRSELEEQFVRVIEMRDFLRSMTEYKKSQPETSFLHLL